MKNAVAVLNVVPTTGRLSKQAIIPQLMTAGQVAEMLAVSHKTVLSWSELGKIPSFKLGPGKKAPVRFDLNRILAWMQTWQKGPETGYHTSAETVTRMRKGKVKK